MRPPKMKPAAGAAGDGAKDKDEQHRKPTASHARPQQSPRRRGQLNPPVYPEPAGAKALRLMAALWGPPRTRRGRS